MFEIALHEKLESRTTNFTQNLCISSLGVGTGEFLASAQSTCIIKTGFWGFLVAVSSMGVNTWPKAFEKPFGKAVSRSSEDTSEGPSGHMCPRWL